jgi:Flp pilus assembly protein TadG
MFTRGEQLLADGQRGLALVEYAITVPILLMLIMATAEFGRALMQYNALTRAVQDGARFTAGQVRARAGTSGAIALPAGLQTEAQNLVVYGNAVGAGSPVLPGLTTGDVTVALVPGENITVTANYAYDSLFVFIPAFIYGAGVNTSAYTFQAAVTMRVL